MPGLLTRPTLILNRNWQPVAVATVARALVKVYREVALVVDPADYRQYTWDDWAALEPKQDEPAIRTCQGVLRAPEVVTLTRYDKQPTQGVTFSRRNVFKRDRFSCQYCGRQPGSEELTIDHVLPRSRGGLTNWDNCVLACIDCNSRKADRTPVEARMPLKRRPGKPHWNPLYTARNARITSWSRFVSEAYWNVELED